MTMDILSWNFDHQNYDEEKPILINATQSDDSISKAQAVSYIRHLIAGYKTIGLKPGDCVCVIGFSDVILPIFYLSIIGAGCRVVGGNPSYTKYELAEQFTSCNVKLVLSQQQLLTKVKAAAEDSTQPRILTYGDDSWKELLEHGEEDWIHLDEQQANEEIAMFLSTSGTTGSPKFAGVSHSYITSVARNIVVDYQNKPYDVKQLICLPLMHAFAGPLVIGAAFRSGIPTYIASRFETNTFLEAVEKFKITNIPMVPSMMKMLLAKPSFATRDLTSIEEILSAGAPLSSDVKEQFDSLLPKARINQLYGATEAGWICWTAVDVQSQATPSIGQPLPGYFIALWNPETEDLIVDPQTPGEMLVNGPSTFKYYLNNSKATESCFVTINGARYYKTGDLAYRDPEGNFFIIDRLKDLIKVRGWQVAPTEIEHVIAQCPGVRDAAVVGVKDAEGLSGELPIAFIDGDAEESTVQSWITSRLASYKWPTTIRYIAQIPRNPAGKVLRRALLAEL